MTTSLRNLAACAIGSCLLLGCPGEAPPAAAGSSAKPRKDDPKLTQSWKMAAEHSPMSNGDLGTEPEALAQPLYDLGMPGITHKIAKSCGDAGELKGVASLAMRFAVDAEGKLGKIVGDPAGPAAACLAKAFAAEMETKLGGADKLPAGAALLRLKFHPPKK